MTTSDGSEAEEAGSSRRSFSAEDGSSRPSSRTENASAFVSSKGLLDLSNIGLTALSGDFHHEYSMTKELDVSKNKLKSCNMSHFHICTKVNISENYFSSLSSLLPSSRKLDVIIASDNEIKITNKLQDFVTLSALHLCRNAIKSFPPLKFANLTFLDLSENMITEFPDISSMHRLEILLLANNSLRSLKLPIQHCSNLKTLDISGNPISNLCEVYHLEKFKNMVNLSLTNIPCLAPFEEYHFKSFLLVIFPSLLFINNIDVLEIESFNAEFLTLRGNLTGLHSKFSYSSGKNDDLAEYLREQSVLTDDSGKMPMDPKLFKMMQARSQSCTLVPEEKRAMSASITKPWQSPHQQQSKENRRKSFAACKTLLGTKSSDFDTAELMTTDDDLSVHSPFGNYIAQLGKENQCPRKVMKKKSDGSVSSGTLVMSSDSHRSQFELSPDSQRFEETSLGALTPTPEVNPFQVEQTSKVLNTTFTKEDKEELNQIKTVIEDLYDSNAKLYMVQDIISETMKQMDDIHKERLLELHKRNLILEERCRNLEEKLTSLEGKAKGPMPIIQKAIVNNKLDEIALSWVTPVVKGYNVIMDGSVIGTVKGERATIGDICTGDHSFKVQTVLWDGTLGQVSQEITICDEEEGEGEGEGEEEEGAEGAEGAEDAEGAEEEDEGADEEEEVKP